MAMAQTEAATSRFRLTIDGGHPAAEVTLLDHRLREIDRGLGSIDRPLPEGVYRARVQLGRLAQERAILLDRDTTEIVAPTELSSPAPLRAATNTYPSQREAAERESRRVHFAPGRGASLFVFTRWWTADATRGGPEADHPARGLSLWAFDGERLADLVSVGESQPGVDGWSALTAQVNPGCYVLRCETELGAKIEQSLAVAEGWQTQVFLLRRRDSGATRPRYADEVEFGNLAVLMDRDDFRSDAAEHHLAEVARLALADERPMLSSAMLELLVNNLSNPVLGMFAAHLMLAAEHRRQRRQDAHTIGVPVVREAEFDRGLFSRIIETVAEWLGRDQPDVRALSLETVGGVSPGTPVLLPPILRPSWSLLVSRTNEPGGSELVDRALWKRIAHLTGGRPFLSWLAASDRKFAADRMLGAALRAHLALTRDPDEQARNLEPADQYGFDEAPGRVIRQPLPAGDAFRRNFSINLDVPRFAIDEALEGG